jgi:hypothetical protein
MPGMKAREVTAAVRHSTCIFAVVAVSFAVHAQSQSASHEQTDTSSTQSGSKIVRGVENLLNMAGTEKAKEFRPMTQAERNHLYLTTMINPFGFARCAFSAGIDHLDDKPFEWEQGASGYGKRYANIWGQYSIQRTVSYGLGSVLHEDTRYFNSGKQGFWPRTGYALSSGLLARHDDGTRQFSISQVGGVAAGAFLARTWLPPSQHSAGDAAVSFGITMGSNIGFGVMKEFLPDLLRLFRKKQN